MRPMPIVVMQPRGEGTRSFFRMSIEPDVGPLEERGFDEAFGLAVGAGRVGTSEEVANPELSTGRREAPRAIARAVVRHDSRHSDPETAQATDGATQEADGGAPAFIGQHLAVADARVIVDGHVRELPAGAPHRIAT